MTPIPVEADVHVSHTVEDGLSAVLAFAQRVLGSPAFGHVLQDAGDPVDSSWSFDGIIGQHQVPFPKLGIGVLQFVADNGAFKTLIHFLLNHALEDPVIKHLSNVTP